MNLSEYKTTSVTTEVFGADLPVVDYKETWAWVDHTNAVVLSLGLNAKHAKVLSLGQATVSIGSDGNTRSEDNPDSDGCLEITFPEYQDWHVLHAFTSRYTLYVVLTPPTPDEMATNEHA